MREREVCVKLRARQAAGFKVDKAVDAVDAGSAEDAVSAEERCSGRCRRVTANQLLHSKRIDACHFARGIRGRENRRKSRVKRTVIIEKDGV